jgi:divinyl chlorophyllide a 8-vinyl-reductase
MLFEALGRKPKFKHVPVWVLDAVIFMLKTGAFFSPKLGDKAELARIGRYYATESMLVFDPSAGKYSELATPSTGSDTLREHYKRMISGEGADDRGAHAVF